MLTKPLEVECSTKIEPTARHIWGVTLKIAWPTTPGVPAGADTRELYVLRNGTVRLGIGHSTGQVPYAPWAGPPQE